jgi:hypothetical protein
VDGIAIQIPKEDIAGFCKKWKIRRFSLFGSVLTDAFRPDSDIDVLVEFEPDHPWSLFDHVQMQEERSGILGRKVDLVSRAGVERSRNYIRRKSILRSAQTIYEAA